MEPITLPMETDTKETLTMTEKGLGKVHTIFLMGIDLKARGKQTILYMEPITMLMETDTKEALTMTGKCLGKVHTIFQTEKF